MSAQGAILTQRDTAVLFDMYKYRYLSVSQIQQLHFPSLQTTYRRLRALTTLGYIKGFLVPTVPEHIYYLGQQGMIFIASHLGVDTNELKWHRTSQSPKDSYFVQHFLNTTDFRIALTLSCNNAGLSLLGFIPEYYGEKPADGDFKKYIKDIVCDISNQTTKISHTPDAVFALNKNQASALFFLEIDRGTEVISNEEKGVLKSIKFYINYLIGGTFQRYQTDFQCAPFKGFRALIVTSSEARLENIRKVVSNCSFDDKAKKFIWLTVQNQITVATIFQPIWRVADIQDNNLYRIG